MPIYEYRCRECDHQFEILQRLGEGADDLACPRCDRHELEKLFSTFAACGDSQAPATMPAGGCCRGTPT
jgi:putative FmdB family regulatory protein